MCDHYTNEVNGSAVLTIRWMPPSGTVPLYVCVCVCVTVVCIFGPFWHRWTQEAFYCGQTSASLSPSVPPSWSLLISQRYVRSSKSCGIIFELYRGFRRTNDFSQAITSGQISGVYSFYLFIYFLLITNAKTSEAFYKLRFCLCPSTCYLV